MGVVRPVSGLSIRPGALMGLGDVKAGSWVVPFFGWGQAAAGLLVERGVTVPTCEASP